MAKFVLYSDMHVGKVSLKEEKTETDVLKLMQAIEPDMNWHTCKIIPSGSHVCKYCGNIAEGTHEDMLCADCRATFGHTMFYEL